jgi:hypothetical protein
MDFLIIFLNKLGYAILLIALFTAIFFGILKATIALSKMFNIEGVYAGAVNFAEKITENILGIIRKGKYPIMGVLLILIILFAYVDYATVEAPIAFKREKEYRYKFVIQKLKDIRTAENAFKEVYSRYTGSFDTLINFVKYDSLVLVRNMGSYNEDTLTEERAVELGIILRKLPDTLTAERAVELGYVVRDTIKVSVLDSIFPPNYSIDSIKYIPFTNGAQFKLGATILQTASGVKVPVFEAVDMAPFDKWDTLKVGSLTEANNGAGNWE